MHAVWKHIPESEMVFLDSPTEPTVRLCESCHVDFDRSRVRSGANPVSKTLSARKISPLKPVTGFNYDLCVLHRASPTQPLTLQRYDMDDKVYHKLCELEVGLEYSSYITGATVLVLCSNPKDAGKSILYRMYSGPDGFISKKDVPLQYRPGCAVFVYKSKVYIAGGMEVVKTTNTMHVYCCKPALTE